MKQIFSTKAEEIAYRAHPALNQSSMKELEKGVDHYNSYLSKTRKVTESLMKGKIVDTYLTTNYFDDVFYILEEGHKMPSEAVKNIVEDIYLVVGSGESTNQDDLKEHEEIIAFVLARHTWYDNLKMVTRVSKIVAEGSDYFRTLIKGQGKEIISKAQYDDAMNVVESIKANPITGVYFNEDDKEDGVTIFYQVPIYFTYEGIEIKSLVDFIVVRELENNVVEITPFDLKTTSTPVIDFISNVDKYRYDLQAAVYSIGIQESDCHSLFNIAQEKEIVINPFHFLVESTTYPGSPAIFVCKPDIIAQGMYGKYSFDGHTQFKKGFEDILDDYKYYLKNGFNVERKIAENNYVLNLSYVTNI